MTADLKAAIRLEAAERRPAKISAVATEAQRAAIAERFGLDRVTALSFTGTVRRLPPGVIYEASGEATMTAERVCVVTLEPFLEETTASFEELFTTDPAAASDEDALAGPDEAEVALLEEDSIDLAEIALQYLALELDPHPRSPEALTAADESPAEESESESGGRRPFAGLDRLLAARDRDS